MNIGYWCKNHKENDHKDDQEIGGLLILKWIFERDLRWCERE
jgi:hypothetical protein